MAHRLDIINLAVLGSYKAENDDLIGGEVTKRLEISRALVIELKLYGKRYRSAQYTGEQCSCKLEGPT